MAPPCGSLKIGVPQLEQKLRVMSLPESPFTVNRVGVPFVSRNAVIGTTTTVAKPPPEAYWQSRQWQFMTASGSDDTS
jgi:hypothetical protein